MPRVHFFLPPIDELEPYTLEALTPMLGSWVQIRGNTRTIDAMIVQVELLPSPDRADIPSGGGPFADITVEVLDAADVAELWGFNERRALRLTTPPTQLIDVSITVSDIDHRSS